MNDAQENAAPDNAATQPDYLSYLLRLWRIRGETAAWRGSLESPLTGARLGFGSLDELFAFLREQTGTLQNGTCHPPTENQDV